MKKIAAILLVLVLICTAAMAAGNKPVNLGDQTTKIKLDGDFVPNGDGTHSQKEFTVDCDYEEVTVGSTTVKACPVCGEFIVTVNGETETSVVKLCKNRNLSVRNLFDAATAVKYGISAADEVGWKDYAYNFDDSQCYDLNSDYSVYFMTNGQYMVRILYLNNEDIKYVVTVCHEIAGKTYAAEGPYAFMLPVDARGCTVQRAYFGGVKDVKAQREDTNYGLYFKPYDINDVFGMYIIK